MNTKKNKNAYWLTVKDIFLGLTHKSVYAYILLQHSVYLLGAWAVVAIQVSQKSPSTLSYIFAARELFMSAVVMFIVQAYRRVDIKIIWRSMLLLSIGATFMMSVVDMSSSSFVALLVIAICGFKASQALIAIDTYSVIRKSNDFALKISLFMFLSPVLLTILSVAYGWLAEVNISLVFLMSGFLGLLCYVITLVNPPDIKKLKKEHSSSVKMSKKSELLVVLCMSHNFFNTVINFIILPIFLYQQSNGDFVKFGFYIGLSGLAAMIGNQLYQKLKNKSSKPIKITKSTFKNFISIPY